jgi:hypothetical protein
LHPDKNQNKPESVRKKAEEQLKQVLLAKKYLDDPNNNPFSNPPKLEIVPKNIRFKNVEPYSKKPRHSR